MSNSLPGLYEKLKDGTFISLTEKSLQSMPVEWQKRFVALMRELDEKCHEHGIACGPYKVYAHDERGRFKSCPFGSYERGRRNVFEERKRTG